LNNILSLRNISTRYDHVEVLNRINLSVDRDALVSLLGANGAGKTTLLRTILNLVKPYEGEIYLGETRIDGLHTNKIVSQGIAIVPEGRGLFPKMTVLENLFLGAYLVRDLNKKRRRLEATISLFPVLGERLKQSAGTLSGGEQAMVSIARGLMSDPRLLLLDEPSLGLAPLIVEKFFITIAQVNKENRISILLVEQNARKALSIASYGYVLQKGRIIVEGTPDRLLESSVIKQAYLKED
jgi:branched-chain amino acid transport system ATP-binding protein